MPIAIENQPEIDEKVWNAWIQKGRRRDEVTARHMKVLGGIIFVVLAFGSAVYLLATA
jgi:hypothetical protein